jgi:hypothetical protein
MKDLPSRRQFNGGSMEATNEILTVTRIIKDGGDWCAECPHFKRIVGLPSGPVRGEQFQDRTSSGYGCGGWFDVSSDARAVRPKE